MIPDELDEWFNEQDEKTIEIINHNFVAEEEDEKSDSENYNSNKKQEPMDEDQLIESATKRICVEDILKKDPKILSSFEIIQFECSIAYFVQVLMEGSANKIRRTHNDGLTFDKMQSIVEYLGWISLASEVLAKRIGQELIDYSYASYPSIIRSSYNFCNKYTQCKNFYSKNESPNCKEHHYVHSLLKNDVDSVIYFLKYVIKDNIFISHDELNNLYLSIKTICFVTRHMAKEISYIHYITKNNSETFHRNNPFELNKKKLATKKFWNENARPSKMMRIDTPKPPTDRYPENNKKYDNGRETNENTNSFNYRHRNYGHHQNYNQNNKFSTPRGGFQKSSIPTINSNNPKKDMSNNRYSILLDNNN